MRAPLTETVVTLPGSTVARVRTALTWAASWRPWAFAVEAEATVRELNTFAAMSRSLDDEPEPGVIDGGLAWDSTLLGLRIFDGNGRHVVTLRYVDDTKRTTENHARLAVAIGEALGLVRLRH